MAQVVLTSFVEGQTIPADAHWSGARWAPQSFQHWPVATWAQPMDRELGFAWKLSEFGPVGEGDMAKINTYHAYALNEYRGRWPEIKAWLKEIENQRIVLACWCPFSSIGRRQLDRYGTFHCHLSVVRRVLEACEVEVSFGQQHGFKMKRESRPE